MPRKPKTDPNQEPARQRQIKFTPSDREEELIKMIAEWWNVSESTIVSRAVHDQLDNYIQQIERGERFLSGSDRSEVNPLRLLLLRLAAGETVAESELTLLAHDCGVPIETLKQIRDCLIQEGQHVRAM